MFSFRYVYIFNFCLFVIDIVHRDLKLENILLKNTPKNKTDEFDIRVCCHCILFVKKQKTNNTGNRFWTKFKEKYN